MRKVMSLSPSITEVKKFNVPGVKSKYHMSPDKSGRIWVSDDDGSLVQTDQQGNQLQKIQSSGRYGYHSVTQDGELIITDNSSKVINKITQGYKITELINTGDWEPTSIHSSHINGDILVGMVTFGKSKITRYNKTGEEVENIQRYYKGQTPCSNPRYITENINGDVRVSDKNKAVMAVNKLGKHRFYYTGQTSKFCPYKICTDVLGHILVCDFQSETVHLLDEDGRFLSLLLTKRHGLYSPRSLCVDDEGSLYVGQYKSNTVTVYRYLQ
jgi:streptogramin lyase